ncbi:MAG: hypothetical protein GVY34_01695, partial [Alphaproteobacteria bacterium]|nr:hypothetical protein [Alphaproteobacteria bacterium]
YGTTWDDELWKVRIELEDPAQVFDLGFSAILDEGIDNESFGIAAMDIQIVPGAHENTRFVPDPNDLLGRERVTLFKKYAGCPDDAYGGRSHILTNDDFQDPGVPTRHRVRAGGQSNLSNCGSDNSSRYGYLDANPTIILDWDGQQRTGSGNRLQISTDDGNLGKDCDSMLYVEDPNGQVFYSNATSLGGFSSDLNVRLDMENAQDGRYAIWVGSYHSGYCNTDFVVDLY